MADGARSKGVVVVATAAFIVLVLLAAWFPRPTPNDLDLRISEKVYARHNAGLDLLMRAASPLGSTLGVIVAAGALAITAWHEDDRRGAVIAAGIVIAAIVLNPLLKTIFARPRPELIAVISAPRSYAFPSGHAAGATAAYTMAAVELGRLRPRWRVWLRPAAVTLIVLVGVSRVYLGVHWPSDVAAGWAFGLLMACMGCWALRRE